jgi:Na+/H+ antiporter NhaD/arsenite permease-like protein
MLHRRLRSFIGSSIGCALLPGPVCAAPLDGSAMSWMWGLPFLGILATIAVGPLAVPKIWHRHHGKLAAFWAGLTLVAIGSSFGAGAALDSFLHAALVDYLSFIVLLFALFTVAGGILVTGTLRGTPATNTTLLAIGTAMASIVGTTGAAMIMVRPLIRANVARARNAHVLVFSIILIANVGGALTPVGNPPLFVGFLHGVEFFWTARTIWLPTAFLAGLLLALFFGVDVWRYRRDRRFVKAMEPLPRAPLRVRGLINLVLVAAILGLVLLSTAWRPNMAFSFRDVRLELQNLVRDAGLVVIALASVLLTPREHREANGFSWEPIKEVAKLFAGIFVCLAPVLAMLQAGRAGAFAPLLQWMADERGNPNPVAYFWIAGALSAVLDNAPTYLVFFDLAGGNPVQLMGPLAGTLAAISMGAVYMGALTYLGNAPNLMVYAIATERGLKMPSFFAYAAWASVTLVPLFGVITVLFVH